MQYLMRRFDLMFTESIIIEQMILDAVAKRGGAEVPA